jgi:hypothetical protein
MILLCALCLCGCKITPIASPEQKTHMQDSPGAQVQYSAGQWPIVAMGLGLGLIGAVSISVILGRSSRNHRETLDRIVDTAMRYWSQPQNGNQCLDLRNELFAAARGSRAERRMIWWFNQLRKP